MSFLKNPWLLGTLTAIVTAASGYAINQLPEIPNKSQNGKWIVLAVIVLSPIAPAISLLSQRSSSGASTRVSGNELKGDRNTLRVTREADVSDNILKGESNQISVDSDPNPPNKP